MIKIENLESWGLKHAIRGMRNPMNSWSKSDSAILWKFPKPKYIIGENDLTLMKQLNAAGPEHRKYLRQIFVSLDITAPLYWWKEFDTYKIGTVSNSCSTMHKIGHKEFDIGDFSCQHLDVEGMELLMELISFLNRYREKFKETKHKREWWQMIQLLPSSYNQKRTVTMNYENVLNIIKQRKNHKLDEWHHLIYELSSLPYIKQLSE